MNELLSVKDVLGFAIERTAALNNFWNLFIVVATAVVGIMASGKPFTNSKLLKIFLSIAFILFAYTNLTAILKLANLRAALLDMIPKDIENIQPVIDNLTPPGHLQYIVYHGMLDIVVVAAIWFVPWSKLTGQNKR